MRLRVLGTSGLLLALGLSAAAHAVDENSASDSEAISGINAQQRSFPEQQLLRDQRENQRIATYYDTALESERRDEAWASITERQATELLDADANANSILLAIECKSTFCRASTRHKNVRQRDDLIEDLGFTKPFNTGGFVQVLPDELTVVIYFHREGYLLPEVPHTEQP